MRRTRSEIHLGERDKDVNPHFCNVKHAELRQWFYRKLSPYYLQGELQALYHWCVEELHGWSRAVAYGHNEETVSADAEQVWRSVVKRLEANEPVQYIFGKAQFMGLEVNVSPAVLIPRPETEELVEWVCDERKEKGLRVLDIGCGSGCIALALKSQRPLWDVWGMDVSEGALKVAQSNAEQLGLEVDFKHGDVQATLEWMKGVDVVVSNPPYIPLEEKQSLDPNVRDHEPELALFAPAGDPFYFYRLIAQQAQENGVKYVYVETHHQDMALLEEELRRCWTGSVITRKDLAGKDRLIRLGPA